MIPKTNSVRHRRRIGDRVRRRAFDLYRTIETREHRLFYLFFEITRRCNLSCLHCGSDCSSEAQGAELSTDSWQRIAAYVADHFDPPPIIVITGGEPLVHPDLDAIAEAINRCGLSWGVVTNGIALTEDRLSRLVDRGGVSVTVSLDGAEASHNYIRNTPIAYDRAVRAVRAVGSSGIRHRDVVTCVYPGNLADLAHTADILVDAGINSWRLFRIFPLGRAAGNSRLHLSRTQTTQLLEWIAEHRPHYRRQGLTVSYSCEGYLPFSLDRQMRDDPFFCRSGINFASILSDGTITGCNNNSPAFAQGNVLRDDFAAVWLERFQLFRDHTWMRNGPCVGCRHWNRCLGGSLHLRADDTAQTAFCYLPEKKRG